MSCGLKKQTTNEGGVHLTERTCSPYNPIIKLIVDDCLGLPIYPVSSVDAVIDEEGNTLRKLLDELTDSTKDSEFNLTEIQSKITEILEKIQVLWGAQINPQDIETLQVNLQNLTEWITAISTMHGEELGTPNTSYPWIVKKIEEIAETLGGSGTNVISRLQALENLARAIATYDTTYEYETIPMEIISVIEDLKDRVTTIENDGAVPNDIEERLASLEELVGDFAHLEPSLKEQGVLKLKGQEYPVTLLRIVESYNPGISGCLYPYYKSVELLEGSDHLAFDYDGDRILSANDVTILAQDILIGKYTPDLQGKTYYVNNDAEINLGDINALVDIILCYLNNECSTGLEAVRVFWPSTTREYVGVDKIPVDHPLIKGKLYVLEYVDTESYDDPVTYRELYVWSGSKFIKASSGIDIIGEGFVKVAQSDLDDALLKLKPTTYTVKSEIELCVLVQNERLIANLSDGDLFIQFKGHDNLLRFGASELDGVLVENPIDTGVMTDTVSALIGTVVESNLPENQILEELNNLKNYISETVDTLSNLDELTQDTLNAIDRLLSIINLIDLWNTFGNRPTSFMDIVNYGLFNSDLNWTPANPPRFNSLNVPKNLSDNTYTYYYKDDNNIIHQVTTSDEAEIRAVTIALYDYTGNGVIEEADVDAIKYLLLNGTNEDKEAFRYVTGVEWGHLLYRRNSNAWNGNDPESCYDAVPITESLGKTYFETSNERFWIQTNTFLKYADPKITLGTDSNSVSLYENGILVSKAPIVYDATKIGTAFSNNSSALEALATAIVNKIVNTSDLVSTLAPAIQDYTPQELNE